MTPDERVELWRIKHRRSIEECIRKLQAEIERLRADIQGIDEAHKQGGK